MSLRLSVRKRDSLWFGVTCVALSLAIGVPGYFRAKRPWERTTGTITALSDGQPGGKVTSGSQRVLYRYQVAGVEYSAETLTGVTGPNISAIVVGATIPVYYDRATPAISYARSPPQPANWLGGILIVSAFGVIVICVGWPN